MYRYAGDWNLNTRSEKGWKENMSGIWVFIVVTHICTIVFGLAIWLFYKKYKDMF
jgi:hypothetical protein